MLRILHTADWQTGRTYSRFDPDDGAALSEARFTAIERIAEHARQGAFDCVVVAGDVFDAQTISERAVRRTFNAMQAYDGPWVLMPGNHDAALAESVWTRAQRMGVIPDNVHLALTPAVLLLHALKLAVLPAPLVQRHTVADLTAWFDHAETPPGYVRLGVAHGSVQGVLAEGIDAPNPIAANRTDTARLDYLALGDWHGMRRIDARTWYSGTPETDRFRNNESGQVLDVEIVEPGAEPVVRPHRIGQYTWQAWQAALTLPTDVDALIERLDGLESGDVIELTLSGTVTLADRARLDDRLGAAQARARALQYDDSALRLQPTQEDISALHADGYLGDVFAALQAMQNETQTDEAGGAGASDSEAARDALALLATIVNEVRQ